MIHTFRIRLHHLVGNLMTVIPHLRRNHLKMHPTLLKRETSKGRLIGIHLSMGTQVGNTLWCLELILALLRVDLSLAEEEQTMISLERIHLGWIKY